MAEIRTYDPLDFPQIRKNLEEAGIFYDLRDTQENYDTQEDRDPNSIFVAEIYGEVVGSVASDRFGISIARMWSMAVAEKYRRQGIATQLAEVADESLREKGVKEVWGFVHVDNIASQQLLKKLGFETNTENIYYGPWKSL